MPWQFPTVTCPVPPGALQTPIPHPNQLRQKTLMTRRQNITVTMNSKHLELSEPGNQFLEWNQSRDRLKVFGTKPKRNGRHQAIMVAVCGKIQNEGRETKAEELCDIRRIVTMRKTYIWGESLIALETVMMNMRGGLWVVVVEDEFANWRLELEPIYWENNWIHCIKFSCGAGVH